MLAGDNGILTRTTDAKEKSDIAQIQEEIQLAWNGVQVDGITKGWDNSTKANALNTELLKEDGNASATWNTTDSVIDVTYKGYETTINPNTGAMTALAKAGAGAGGFGSEENGEIDWENIIATVQKHSDQSDSNGDIGIDANGNACNLDLWEYTYESSSECWILGSSYDSEGSCCYIPFTDSWDDSVTVERTNIVCPQYIKKEGTESFYPVCYLGTDAFRSSQTLQSVKLPSTLQHIGMWAFAGCTNLEGISIPEEVEIIDNFSFELCESLKVIELPASLEYLGQYALPDNIDRLKIKSDISGWDENAFRTIFSLDELYVDNEGLSARLLSNDASISFADIAEGASTLYLKTTCNCSEGDSIDIWVGGCNRGTYIFKGIIDGYSKFENNGQS